jgi:hypothetical protein
VSDRVYALVVTAEGAAVSGGVAVGDPLSDAFTSYRGLRCGRTSGGGEYREWPYCVGAVGARRFVWFGEDPIASVTVSETSLLGGA